MLPTSDDLSPEVEPVLEPKDDDVGETGEETPDTRTPEDI